MRSRPVLSRAVACAVVLATACGGGGDGSPTPIVPTRITFGVQPDSALVGDTVALGASVTDPAGRSGTTGTIVYATSDSTVARVSATGTVRFVGPGTAVVVAHVTGLPGGNALTATTATLVVLSPAVTLRALPTRIDAAPGAIVPLVSLVYDASGTRIRYPVDYATTNAAVATVTPNGFTAVGAGSAQITAHANFRGRGVLDAVIPVTVAPVTPGAFHIDLQQVGVANAAYAAVFARAAEFWQTVITTELASATVDVAAGACGDGTPAVHATTTGVTILFSVDSIDGKGAVLGAAGPCVLRRDVSTEARGLPVLGTMRFDSADFATLVSRGTAYDVIRHEMGHVLGIGTLWNVTGVRADLTGAGSLDPQYVGPAGEGGSAAIGFTLNGAPVPVENTGGVGTADAHWRSSVYQSELMTGYLVNAATHPASRLTVLSLADLGYVVNPAASEPLLPASTRSVTARGMAVRGPAYARASGDILTDVALPPLYKLAVDGQLHRLRVIASRVDVGRFR